MDKMKIIKRLLEEAKAAAPIVKEAGQAGGALTKEAELAGGQKIAQKLMSGDEYAQKMAALKAAKQQGQMARVAGVATMPTANELITNPLQDLAQMYSNIRQPISDATRAVGEKIADVTNPNPYATEEQKQALRDTGGLITSVALDPTNFLAPGAGLAVGAADALAPEAEKPDYEQLRKMMGKP